MNWKKVLLAFLVVSTLGAIYPQVTDDSLIWKHLQADFRLDHQVNTNPSVRVQRDWYVANSTHLEIILERSSPFLYLIVEELERRNMPGELALLPVIESSYDPNAYSHSHAAGLWQMIPSTGRNYGLEQNNWYDGRRDIYASTHAALDYLEKLNKQFKGDWPLTIAAYHAGEGNISRAIASNKALGKPADVWSIFMAKPETRGYVQRFLALSDVIKHAHKYGVNLPEIPNEPAVILVKLNKQIDLNRAASLAGISINELYAYNPGFINRTIRSTPPDGPHHLLLPITSVKPLTKRLAALDITRFSMWDSIGGEIVAVSEKYRVQTGDTLGTIAQKHDTSIGEIRDANQLKSDIILVGQRLVIPESEQA